MSHSDTFVRLTALFLLTIPGQAQQHFQVLHKHVRPAVTNGNATPLDVLPAGQRMKLVIHLPLRNQAELIALLTRQADPASADYHKWLSVDEFTARFGRTEAEYAKVADFAAANGLSVDYRSPNRLMLMVGGSVEQVEKTFNVKMRTYRHPTENRVFFSTDREPSFVLDVPVSHISGLNNYSLARPSAGPRPAGMPAGAPGGSGPGSSFLGSDMRTAYNMGSNTGVGQTVGLVEFSGYTPSDVSLYFSNLGQTNNVPITNVVVDNTSATSWSSANREGEVCLDIEQAISVAPGLSQVRVYIDETGSNFDGAVLSRMATDNIAKQLSSSWYWWPDDPATDDPYFEEMAAQGQTFFSISGDLGAYIGQDSADAGYPAEDTHVTTVGGTALTLSGGQWQSEVAWNSYSDGSGGGPANDGPAYFSIPSWQIPVINSSNGGSTTLRNSPDVAMQADFYNYICYAGGLCQTNWGGTSFAAPRWAAWMALVNQQVVADGHAAGLGFINPMLYSIGQSAAYNSNFHDVTSGNNNTAGQAKFYYAVPGYDLVTGWGSPNGQNLMNSLIAATNVCTPTLITPYLQVGTGALQATNSATVSFGSAVSLSPQPSSDGSWTWAGPNGYVATTREIDNIPLSVGTNTFVATYTNAGGCKSAVTFTLTESPAQGTGTPFILGQTPGPQRNNYSGFVGFEFNVGPSALQISALGRIVAPGNSGTHLLKLVRANGTDVPGGSASVTSSGVTGQYQYAELASPVSLLANTSYYLVSQETAGGDLWYDIGSVTSTADASVVAPAYTDGSGNYVPVAGLPRKSYGPLNFLYAASTSAVPALSVAITSPQNGATVSGSIVIVVAASSTATTLQLQVDGANQGPANALTLDTTLLTNGSHQLTVVASDSQGDSVVSAAVTVTVNNASTVTSPTGTPFVTGQPSGTLRNNYSGLVGFSFTTGSTAVVVNALGRYVVAGGNGTHLVKLVNSLGNDVPGASVSLSLAGAASGQYLYAPLAASVTLSPNSSYYLVSQESAGGDQWYDIGPISVTSVAAVNAPVYADSAGRYVSVAGLPGQSYVPVSFLYQTTTAATLTAVITSPQANATVTGTIPITVTTTGNPVSFQLRVDGLNQGAAISSNALTLNTTTLTNSMHTLTVVVSDGQTTATSPAVSVTVANAPTTGNPMPFLTAQTPSTLRNNYTGFVGMEIQVGPASLTISSLGRIYPSGNVGTHLLKLVQSNGSDLPGGAVSITVSGGAAGQYVYGTLSAPVTLQAGATYYLVSQETAGADFWYDFEPVTSTGAAQVLGPVYTDGHGAYVLVPGLANYSYVPVNFQYQ